MRATLELIGENGFHNTSMSMIAESAGVAAGTIYHYFKNKDALINELNIDFEKSITSTITEGYNQEKPVRERFLHMTKCLIQYYIEHPLEFRFVQQFYTSPYGVLHRRTNIHKRSNNDIFHKLAQEGIAQQVIKDLPIILLQAIAFGPMVTVMYDHILGFLTLDDSLIERTAEACWDAIRR